MSGPVVSMRDIGAVTASIPPQATVRTTATGSGPTGPPGDPGVVISAVPPADHDSLWADTTAPSDTTADTIEVFVYTDEADARPDATVVFWIPNPYDLPNPYGAVTGDCVLRSTPDVIGGMNGVEKIWKGTAAELTALGDQQENTIYFVYAPEEL